MNCPYPILFRNESTTLPFREKNRENRLQISPDSQKNPAQILEISKKTDNSNRKFRKDG